MNQLVIFASFSILALIAFAYQTGLFLVAYWNAVEAAKGLSDAINKQN